MITRKLKESILTLSLDPIFNNINSSVDNTLSIPLLIDKIIDNEVLDQDIINDLDTLKISYVSKTINKQQFKIKLVQIVGKDILKRTLEKLVPNIKKLADNRFKYNECSICFEKKNLAIRCLKCKGSICINCNQEWPHICPLCRNEPKLQQVTPGRFIHSIRCLDNRCKFNFCKNNKMILTKLFSHLEFCKTKECKICHFIKTIKNTRKI